WLNFQPGEIRSCGGCHGANTQAQDGSPLPTNPPEALRALMQYYQQAPTDVVTEIIPGDSPTLLGNYPNPFSESTVIRYALAKAGPVSLRLFTITGREVSTLVDEFQPAGTYAISWKPEKKSSGMYVYRLQSGDKTVTQKMVFNK
ncbi:MAG: T9SS type A sorting domain-containing protein, partial [Rhodothermales bacterium]